MNRDFFEHKAEIYDRDDNRVSNVENIANADETRLLMLQKKRVFKKLKL
jgi:hypothetical protein